MVKHLPLTRLTFVALFFCSVSAQAQGYLENPQPNSAQSGIGVVSGWHCDAGIIEFQIDNRRLVPAAYGTERKDTEGVCGDINNGFVFLINYSGMGDGNHTITAYADGQAFGSATFRVATPGREFLRGVQKTVTVADFPSPGDTAVLQWDEAKQSFVLANIQLSSTTSDRFNVTSESVAVAGDTTGPCPSGYSAQASAGIDTLCCNASQCCLLNTMTSVMDGCFPLVNNPGAWTGGGTSGGDSACDAQCSLNWVANCPYGYTTLECQANLALCRENCL